MKVENQTDYSLLLRRQPAATGSASSTDSAAADATDAVALTRPVRIGQSVLYVSLSRTLSFSSSNGDATTSRTAFAGVSDSGSEEDDTVTPTEDNPLGFNYKKVAKNVLGFVTGYLRKAQAEGKDEAALKDLLGQARKGIDQGFGQARDELKGSGLFSEDLDKGISKSYDTIQTGLDKFEKDLLGSEDSASTADSSASGSLTDATASASANPATTPAASSGTSLLGVKGLSALLGSGQSASLSLTTRDGDKITIAFDQQSRWQWQQGSSSSGTNRKALDAYQQTSQNRAQGTQSGQATGTASGSLYYAQTSGFSFAVQGNLSQDELKAVGGLVDQIGSLSDRFFSGDLQGALDQAQKLSWDDSQVASFALDLHQSQWAALSGSEATGGTTTANPQSQTANPTSTGSTNTTSASRNTGNSTDLAALFAPFADYLQHLQTMIQNASTLFDTPSQDQLSRWVVNQQQGSSTQPDGSSAADQFVSFNNRMHQAMLGLEQGNATRQG